MENAVTLRAHHNTISPIQRSRSVSRSTKSIFSSKTLASKPFLIISSKRKPATQSSSLRSSLHPADLTIDEPKSMNHTSLLVESYHHHQRLKALWQRLNRNGSCPLRLLEEDGDWSREHFWTVIRFLKRASRFTEILLVFNQWKNMERSRINEFNYEKIIRLLSEQGMMDEATLALRDMRYQGLNPSLKIYNSVIHGYASKRMFHDAMLFLVEMKDINLSPETDTYNGLIEAYGKYGMYDEIGMCLKVMELDNCASDQITYNFLIRAFSRGGLLKRMERTYQSMMSRKMSLEPSTLLAMLEAHADFGTFEMMEKKYRKVLNSRIALKEDLVCKLARIYIENRMFSRLYNLGQDLYSRNGVSDLVWCLCLLSHACLLSREGIDSVLKEMEEAKVSWNVTVANIILLVHLKMMDFKQMRMVLSKLASQKMKFDIVTLGIVYDSTTSGFDGLRAIESWRRMGLLKTPVEMDTDALVISAFGKGHFLSRCEELYVALDAEARESKTWTYENLVDLIVRDDTRQLEKTYTK